MTALQAQPAAEAAAIDALRDDPEIRQKAVDEFSRLLLKDRQEKPPVPIVNGRLCPTQFDQQWRVANWMFNEGIYPKSFAPASVGKIMAAIAAGQAVGFDPFQSLKAIALINGSPSLWGDALPALVLAQGKMSKLQEETFTGLGEDGLPTDDTVAVCTVYRVGMQPLTRTFSVAEAKVAGLYSKAIWKNYPKRMLQMRARGFAFRDAFADVLGGLSVAEEMQDIITEERHAATESLTDRIQGLERPAPKPEDPPLDPSALGRVFGKKAPPEPEKKPEPATQSSADAEAPTPTQSSQEAASEPEQPGEPVQQGEAPVVVNPETDEFRDLSAFREACDAEFHGRGWKSSEATNFLSAAMKKRGHASVAKSKVEDRRDFYEKLRAGDFDAFKPTPPQETP